MGINLTVTSLLEISLAILIPLEKIIFVFKKFSLGTREMAQWFRAIVAPARGPVFGSQHPLVVVSMGTRYAHGTHTYVQAKHSYTEI